MNANALSLTETESDRLTRLNELVTEQGPTCLANFKPGSLGCHEFLDRTSLLADQIERWLLDHPACLNQPEWFALAEQAASALRDLYQRVGAAHLEAESDGVNP